MQECDSVPAQDISLTADTILEDDGEGKGKGDRWPRVPTGQGPGLDPARWACLVASAYLLSLRSTYLTRGAGASRKWHGIFGYFCRNQLGILPRRWRMRPVSLGVTWPVRQAARGHERNG